MTDLFVRRCTLVASYLLAYDHRLCRSVLRIYVRALFAFHRRRARRAGVPDGQGGAVTVTQAAV